MKLESLRQYKYMSAEEQKFFRDAYVACGDPTGYVFAEKYVEGGYPKWKKLSKMSLLRKALASWQEILEVRLQSVGVSTLVNDAISGSKSASASAKWLASRGWIPKEDKRTKVEKDKAKKAQEEIQEDYKRLGLRLAG